MPAASIVFTENAAGINELLRSETGPYAQWLARVGNQVVNSAKRKANVDTGLMRSRIVFTLTRESDGLVGRVEAQTNYSYYVHEGTRGRPGNPFLRDALREVLSQL